MAGFDGVRATFWGEGPYGAPPPLTDAVVREAEHRLGVRLPASLLELLRDRNGGVVAEAWNAYPTDVPTSWSDDHVPFDLMRGIVEEDGDHFSILDSPYLVEEWGLPSPLVLLSGEGHWWIALDYRTCGAAGEPSVAWFDPGDATELPLAGDFRTFVEGLRASASFYDGQD
ncbi:SMI1/KNR4 family protein [Streptomyces sp. TLI_105]|uniref:SMI1/KNR4 family protein n=1 Tax=Streptomyces sp. TLI_105 TaxID=1881019 RepID=UPI0008986920|nr:SMI1/KNR4 family protein [Streptomyces sp. TLI_105]SEC77991.1 SMI1-KNR4 cell-wall [Streptomyces sp. TLI_105]